MYSYTLCNYGTARLQPSDCFAVPVVVSDADKNPAERLVGKEGVDRLPAGAIGPKGGEQELRDLVFGTYSNASKDSGFWKRMVNESDILNLLIIFVRYRDQKTRILLLDHWSAEQSSALSAGGRSRLRKSLPGTGY